jgi:elongation factor Ts
MSIDASKVKELRERMGLPMMECKRALEQAGGDIELAVENLRKAGAKAVQKLAGRDAKEGRVAGWISPDGKTGVLVTLRCETEPVANNEKFGAFVQELVGAVANGQPADEVALRATKLPSGRTVEEGLTDLVNFLRENITIGAFAKFTGDAIGQYLHFDGKKGAMVALSGVATSNEKVVTLGKDLCMHVVFSRPRALSRNDLDPAFIAKEKEIRLATLKNEPKNASKPAEILEKMIQGQMAKIYEESCFLEQPFIKSDKGASVAESLKTSGTGATLTRFVYMSTDS